MGWLTGYGQPRRGNHEGHRSSGTSTCGLLPTSHWTRLEAGRLPMLIMLSLSDLWPRTGLSDHAEPRV